MASQSELAAQLNSARAQLDALLAQLTKVEAEVSSALGSEREVARVVGVVAGAVCGDLDAAVATVRVDGVASVARAGAAVKR